MDHVGIIACSDFFAYQTSGSVSNRGHYSKLFRCAFKQISSSDDMAGAKGRYRRLPYPYKGCCVGNKPNVFFSEKFCCENMVESIYYGAYDIHTVNILMSFQRNIRYQYEDTPYWNNDFDRQIRINNDNYVIPEIVDSLVVKNTFNKVDHIKPLVQSIYEMIYGEESPDIENISITQLEVTQDFTIPQYQAQQCIKKFMQFMLSKEGEIWRRSRGFITYYFLGQDWRGDCSIMLIHGRTGYKFKCYAQSTITVRIELQVCKGNSKRVDKSFTEDENIEDINQGQTIRRVVSLQCKDQFKALGLSRKLDDLDKTYADLCVILRSLNFESILRRDFQFVPEVCFIYPFFDPNV